MLIVCVYFFRFLQINFSNNLTNSIEKNIWKLPSEQVYGAAMILLIVEIWIRKKDAKKTEVVNIETF